MWELLRKFNDIRQNGAPSGLENRGLDARFAFTTKQEIRLCESCAI